MSNTDAQTGSSVSETVVAPRPAPPPPAVSASVGRTTRICAVLVDGFSFVKHCNDSWDVNPWDQLIDFITESLTTLIAEQHQEQQQQQQENNGGGNGTSALSRENISIVFPEKSCFAFFPDVSQLHQLQLVSADKVVTQHALRSRLQRGADSRHGICWTVIESALKKVGASYKASVEDLELADRANACAAAGCFPPLGSRPERTTATDIFVVTTDGDHVPTLSSATGGGALRWCVTHGSSSLKLTNWGRTTQRLLRFQFRDANGGSGNNHNSNISNPQSRTDSGIGGGVGNKSNNSNNGGIGAGGRSNTNQNNSNGNNNNNFNNQRSGGAQQSKAERNGLGHQQRQDGRGVDPAAAAAVSASSSVSDQRAASAAHVVQQAGSRRQRAAAAAMSSSEGAGGGSSGAIDAEVQEDDIKAFSRVQPTTTSGAGARRVVCLHQAVTGYCDRYAPKSGGGHHHRHATSKDAGAAGGACTLPHRRASEMCKYFVIRGACQRNAGCRFGHIIGSTMALERGGGGPDRRPVLRTVADLDEIAVAALMEQYCCPPQVAQRELLLAQGDVQAAAAALEEIAATISSEIKK